MLPPVASGQRMSAASAVSVSFIPGGLLVSPPHPEAQWSLHARCKSCQSIAFARRTNVSRSVSLLCGDLPCFQRVVLSCLSPLWSGMTPESLHTPSPHWRSGACDEPPLQGRLRRRPLGTSGQQGPTARELPSTSLACTSGRTWAFSRIPSATWTAFQKPWHRPSPQRLGLRGSRPRTPPSTTSPMWSSRNCWCRVSEAATFGGPKEGSRAHEEAQADEAPFGVDDSCLTSHVFLGRFFTASVTLQEFVLQSLHVGLVG